MTNDRVTLKAIKFSETFSQETDCFQANIYFDGKMIGYAENDGHGGCTNCRPYAKNEQFQKCADYCKSLPKIISKEFNFSYDSDIEGVVNNLFNTWLMEKYAKKNKARLERDCKKYVCYGTDKHYLAKGWKSHTILQLLQTPKGIEVLTKVVQDLIANGEIILNTNIPQHILVPK